MRILWVKVGGLWPLTTGGRLRSFHLLSELARRHEVQVVTTHAHEEEADGVREALGDRATVHSVPYRLPRHGTARFAAALARSWLSPLPVDVWKCRVDAVRAHVSRALAAGTADVCVADFLAAAPNVPLGRSRVPVVLFEHNVEHQIWKRMAEHAGTSWRRALLEIEWRKMRRYEARACRLASLTLAVSEADGALLARHAPDAGILAIPTGVDTSFFEPAPARERPGHLVFTGAMDWFPNEDGMLHFFDAILPRIRQHVPTVSVTVVGRRPSSGFAAAAEAAGARVTGTVDDVRPHVQEGAVSIVPLRIGGGTRLKIFEALAMGRAVVSTTVGAEGLPIEPGRHFLRADEPAAFAEAVVGLLADDRRRGALGQAGRALVDAHFSWPQVARTFEQRLSQAMVAHAH